VFCTSREIGWEDCLHEMTSNVSRSVLNLGMHRLSADNQYRSLNFLSGLTAVLPHERLTVLTIMWPHIIVMCPCSPRTLCHVKSIRCHHHHHHHRPADNWNRPITMPVSADCYLLCIMMALDTEIVFF